MVTYTTKFTINDSLTKSEFVKMVIRWNQGSKYDRINDLAWDETDFNCSWKQENIVLSLQEIQEKGIIASRLQKEDEHGV
ncbi:hypothetical protein HMPREF9630_00773 [Peptoanaerobacter stomatis]|uniref:Uncharacterized protein n=1 Tax=Peptoanaerobacter stomatis TaxID=796937 RepID=V9HTV0_9FIRM|nr:hypothetical protein [Peptoanaerobacter stomatis]EHL14995.1 hypothetical protein HMPREF9630_00773 [Peptoanaerobacter stomatis]